MWDLILVASTIAGVTAGVAIDKTVKFLKIYQLKDEIVKKDPLVWGSTRQFFNQPSVKVLWKGTLPLLCANSVMLLFRIGSFNYASKHYVMVTEEGKIIKYRAIVVIGLAGMLSSIVCNPFQYIKRSIVIRPMTLSIIQPVPYLQNTRDVIRHTYKVYGLYGFFMGTSAAITYGVFKYTSYYFIYYALKDVFSDIKIDYDSNIQKFLFAFSLGGPVVCGIATPFEMALKHLHHQPRFISGRGVLYRGFFDCLYKVYERGGIYNLYKGFGKLYLSVGSGMAVNMIAWDIFSLYYPDTMMKNTRVRNKKPESSKK